MKNNSERIKKLVGIASFCAIVIVLQLLSLVIHFGPFSITLALIPIVVGAIIYGPLAGGILGFFMGVVVLLTNADAFLAVNVPATILICLLKSIAAGVVSGFIFKRLQNKNKWLGIILASISAPIVNTGIFVALALPIFYTTLQSWAEYYQYTNVIAYVFLGMVGLNFIVEFSINSILSPVVVKIVNIFEMKFGSKDNENKVVNEEE